MMRIGSSMTSHVNSTALINLIVGPSSAKLEFFKFVHEHHRRLESKVVGVETADHPTGGEIVARARIYFKASDRMGSPDVRN